MSQNKIEKVLEGMVEFNEPTQEELSCACFGVFSPLTDFNNFVVVSEELLGGGQ